MFDLHFYLERVQLGQGQGDHIHKAPYAATLIALSSLACFSGKTSARVLSPAEHASTDTLAIKSELARAVSAKGVYFTQGVWIRADTAWGFTVEPVSGILTRHRLIRQNGKWVFVGSVRSGHVDYDH